MILHRTFYEHGGLMTRGMMEAQEKARADAEAFIAKEIAADDVVCISESALPSTWSKCLVSVTVWYRR
jgi:hypothetical protein